MLHWELDHGAHTDDDDYNNNNNITVFHLGGAGGGHSPPPPPPLAGCLPPPLEILIYILYCTACSTCPPPHPPVCDNSYFVPPEQNPKCCPEQFINICNTIISGLLLALTEKLQEHTYIYLDVHFFQHLVLWKLAVVRTGGHLCRKVKNKSNKTQ